MAKENEGWAQEREDLRMRLELTEARTRKTEDLLAAIAAKLGVTSGENSTGGGSEDEVDSYKVAQGQDRWRKLEIPIFGGEDAFGWVQKLERYFSMRSISESEKMRATLVALEGRALSWYQWWEGCNPSPSWEGFKMAVVRRFQPTMIQNPFELLLSLKQEGSVEVFVEEFEKYAGALKDKDPGFLRGVFLNGLKEEIRVEVRLYELGSLQEVIHKAILIEQKNLVMQRKASTSQTRNYGSTRGNSYNKVVTLEPSSNTSRKEGSSVGSYSVQGSQRVIPEINGSRGLGEYRRLSSTEMKEKREKGKEGLDDSRRKKRVNQPGKARLRNASLATNVGSRDT
ncbi:PREDICTED: uncharacterized protein LOC109359703 [Lupinus angustifolius]|uniref:uncharacterized protein LOC109359703 n=1 Tax=Lupinus angustifolius TaxID=3871 RepID=UPI00092FBFCE|nr:PREDICTED: uncharacterized protein LOC109359703 [Lupinus angustifolius]